MVNRLNVKFGNARSTAMRRDGTGAVPASDVEAAVPAPPGALAVSDAGWGAAGPSVEVTLEPPQATRTRQARAGTQRLIMCLGLTIFA